MMMNADDDDNATNKLCFIGDFSKDKKSEEGSCNGGQSGSD